MNKFSACHTLCAMKPCLTFLLNVMLWLPVVAQAQWQWLNAAGHRVFSDTPPPPSVQERHILKRPQAQASTPAVGNTQRPGEVQAPVTKTLTTEDRALQAKISQAEQAEQASRKVQEAQQAAIRADNCLRAQRAYTAVASGTRLRTINDAGESVFMDEQARGAELQRLQAIVQADCL